MEDIRPTARWANRMLRPLTSVYHRLEKHHEILTSIADTKLKEQSDARKSGHGTTTAPATNTTRADEDVAYSDEEPGDPAWVPGKLDKRRIRHNYSSRGQKNGAVTKRSRLRIGSPERQKTLPGAIEIATPLITGKAHRNLDCSSLRKQLFRSPLAVGHSATSNEPRRPSRTNNASFPAYQGSWKEVLDLSGDAGLVDIAHSLDRILLKFLNNTRITPVHGRGARSLLSMTVRRLPEFVAEEQRIQDELEDDNNDVDMCDAYFTELEAHYAPAGCGWGPMREAVRSQGVHLVSEMIHKGWVTQLAACRLMSDSMNQGEHDAFEVLMSRYLATIDTYPYPTAFDTPKPSGHCDDPIHIMSVYYSRVPVRRSFVFDEMAKMLLRRSVPSEWMVTTVWKKCVDGAIKSMSIGDGNSSAATRLVEAIILAAGGIHPFIETPLPQIDGIRDLRPGRLRDTRASSGSATLSKLQSPCPVPIQDALSNLTSSLVTALCGMSIARSQAPTVEVRLTGVKVRNTIGGLALVVQRAVGMDPSCDNNGPTFQSLRRGYVLLGDLMLRCGETASSDVIGQVDNISRQKIDSFFLSLAGQHDMVKDLAELVRQVFRCCGQAGKGSDSRTHPAIRRKVSDLAQLTDLRGPSIFLGRVAAETAMAFAETTLDTDDHAWAMEVQGMVVSCSQRSAQSPSSSNESSNDTAGLYRWEESIGEWVASTPLPKFKVSQEDRALKQASDMPRFPPTIECSTSSNSPVSSQGDVASSITSSAPSLSIKRTYPSEPIVTRARKRLRESRPEAYMEQHNASFPSKFHQSLSRKSVSGSEHAPIAARTRAARGALQELSQGKMEPTREIPPAWNSVEITAKIEVVIINRRNSSPLEAEGVENPPQPISVRTRSTTRKSLPANPSGENRRLSSARSNPGRVLRRRSVIPCPQEEESEDELSFL